jgi:hypothetical protein
MGHQHNLRPLGDEPLSVINISIECDQVKIECANYKFMLPAYVEHVWNVDATQEDLALSRE